MDEEKRLVATVVAASDMLGDDVCLNAEEQPSEALIAPITNMTPAINELLQLEGKTPAAVLVSCGKAKASTPMPADALYVSGLFRSSMAVAQRLSPNCYILSALHGLLSPREVVSPYDLTLSQLSSMERERWAEKVVLNLLEAQPLDTVVSLAGEVYNANLKPIFARQGVKLLTPLAGLGLGRRMARLKAVRRIYARLDLAGALYDSLAAGAIFERPSTLREVTAARKLPRRGLYIFLDPSEASTIRPGQPRIVRIGTHGVSAGSASTLRSRLRAHLGQASLGGSHRSSIFRLHVGKAMLRGEVDWAGNLSWGVGSTGSPEQRMAERHLEEEVSRTLEKLLVRVVEIADEPSAKSFRAIAEKALIALFTEAGRLLERPSVNWLGHASDKPEIRLSGLWNIQHVGKTTDLKAVRLVISLLDRTWNNENAVTSLRKLP